MKKQVAVIGLGRFGFSLACSLFDMGHDVLAMDTNETAVQTISSRVTHAVQADATNEAILKDLGIANFDVGIVAVGSEIQNSVGISKPDYITFVGDGEPTLCKDLGWLIHNTKTKLGIPVAVITNGSLLFLKSVRRDLKEADIVLPTLDAGTVSIFRRINRPHADIGFYTMLGGQSDFRQEFSGKIWLEVMLVRGLNDSEDELLKIGKAVDMIRPDKVYVATPIRPPAEPWVETATPVTILKAQEILGNAASITDSESGEFGLHEFMDAHQAIMEIGTRHPLRWEQAIEIENAFSARGTIKKMLKEKELFEVNYNNRLYLLPRQFIRGNKVIENEEGKR